MILLVFFCLYVLRSLLLFEHLDFSVGNIFLHLLLIAFGTCGFARFGGCFYLFCFKVDIKYSFAYMFPLYFALYFDLFCVCVFYVRLYGKNAAGLIAIFSCAGCWT